MNRTTVLILAIVLLLAHLLSLHHDASGAFAMPSDLAHVDFRIGRHWVHGQGTTWFSGSTAAAISEEGGTSLAWVTLAALAELFSWSPLRVTAWVGILSALLTLAVIARLSRDRLIGVTAIVLLVVSGPFAASATDGTATALFTLLLTLAFLALERRRAGVLGAALAALVLTGSLGLVYVVPMLGIALWMRRSDRPLALAPAFLPPLAAAAVLFGVRMAYGAPLLPPDLAALGSLEHARVGLWSVEAWVRGTLAPLLILLPLGLVLIGKLSGTGARALLLALTGTLAIVLLGGSRAAMHTIFAPVLPLFFIAVQEAFVGGLERRPRLEWAVWTSLSMACAASILASKTPSDLGPLRIEPALHWMARENDVREAAYGREWNGRPAILRELEEHERLRGIGLFFRDQVAPNARILTPWPGAIGYLSRMQVLDLLGRAHVDPSRAAGGTRSWNGPARTDVVAALERGPEYVVPLIADRLRPPTRAELIERWLSLYDDVGATPARRAELATALEAYELVAISTPEDEADLALSGETPSLLLRRRDLLLAPTLAVGVGGDRQVVRLQHAGHHQLVELEVRAELPGGEVRYLNPTGDFLTGPPLRARTELVLFPTGDRSVRLVDFRVPKELAEARLVARLLNPFSDPSDPLARVGDELELRP